MISSNYSNIFSFNTLTHITNRVTQQAQQHSKITTLIKVIFCTLAALFLIYCCSRDKKSLPTHIKPGLFGTQLPNTPSELTPASFNQVANVCGKLSENALNHMPISAVKEFEALGPKLHQDMLELLNEIVGEYEKKYSYLILAHLGRKINVGEDVPAFNANDTFKIEPTEVKKYKILAGIRNLLMFGPQIFDDFRKNKFIGGNHNYKFDEGLKFFQMKTGNLVDLDLEFQANNDAEAIKEARKMIIEFGKACGLNSKNLTAEDVAQAFPHRKLELPENGKVYQSVSNTDRSFHGVWKYLKPGSNKFTYFANVPNCETVIVTTLKVPYMLAELLYRTKEYKNGILLEEFYKELFEKGISDKCYNDNANVLNEFYQSWMNKVNETPSPEEEAKDKIAKGLFGKEIQAKGVEVALQEAKTCDDLLNIMPDEDYYPNLRSFKQWVGDVEDNIKTFLIEKGLWEAVLYQSEKGQDYFLLNQSSLNLFLKKYYTYLKSSPI